MAVTPIERARSALLVLALWACAGDPAGRPAAPAPEGARTPGREPVGASEPRARAAGPAPAGAPARAAAEAAREAAAGAARGDPAGGPPLEPGASPGRARWGELDVTLLGEGRVAVVLLHGYGGSGDDMLPVAEAFAEALPVRVAVPTSPRAWARGGAGRAWFERAAPDAGAQIERAVREIEAVRAALAAEGRRPTDVVLGGFSQGASLALEAALAGADRPRALVLFSGRVLPRFAGRWGALAGVPVFISHGRSDSLIPFADGERADEAARAAGAAVTFFPFDGGHVLPPGAVAAAIEALRAVAPPP